MIIYIVIPAHNEEDSIKSTLESIVNQSYLPKKVVVVNDNSTDRTSEIISEYVNKYSWLNQLNIESSTDHIPGKKVVHAFNNEWVFENIAKKDHVRGPIKAYRKECFEAIGGLRPSIGWDSVDVLLAQYFGWKVITDKELHVKHLKPTGMTYHNSAKHLQGEALFKMRFGIILSILASLKSALKRRSLTSFINSIEGYNKAKRDKKEYLVNKDQGRFIRKLRWRNIRQRLI